MGRLFREFGVVIGAAVLISAFVSLTLTPMLNAYLMKGGEQKKSNFYIRTEPYFLKLNSGYADALNRFMKRKWLSFPILIACFGLIYLFFNLLKKETAPYDDRSGLMMSITAPEGSSYEYTDRFMQELSQLIDDSIPEKKVALIITSPGFGASTVNSGRIRISLTEPNERSRSQKEIAEN